MSLLKKLIEQEVKKVLEEEVRKAVRDVVREAITGTSEYKKKATCKKKTQRRRDKEYVNKIKRTIKEILEEHPEGLTTFEIINKLREMGIIERREYIRNKLASLVETGEIREVKLDKEESKKLFIEGRTKMINQHGILSLWLPVTTENKTERMDFERQAELLTSRGRWVKV